MEFGSLSRLTKDPKYENVARHALTELWNARSHLNLVGQSINIWTR